MSLTRSLHGAQIENVALKVRVISHLFDGLLTRVCPELEAVLILGGAIIPQPKPPKDEEDENSSDEDDLDDSPPERGASTMTNAKGPKNVRQSKEDDDSDFEFDI